MLQLKNIVKNYPAGDTEVQALRGINLEFRKSEFVAILGHSGCGKTTLLNIVGGLDHYTSGDLIIDGRSTKEFNDDGIKKIQDVVDNDLQDVLDRLDALCSDNNTYTSYSGKTDDMDGNVKFVIETASIDDDKN